jgi:hypothetical protein
MLFMTPEEEAFLWTKAIEIWARHPISWTILLGIYFFVVTYGFVENW